MKNQLIFIDNYDSFSYNLVQYLGELGFAQGNRLRVIRNDELSVGQVLGSEPLGLVFSPGPCTPNEAGTGLELIRAAWGKLPIFGVCLGLQTMVQAMGGKILRAPRVMHGKASMIEHDGGGVFEQIPSPTRMGRYHSLVADRHTLPEQHFTVSAWVASQPGEIMAVRGKVSPVAEAVQFHPESILSGYGHRILANFLENLQSGTIAKCQQAGVFNRSPLAGGLEQAV